MSITLHTDDRFPCPSRLQLVIAHLKLPLKATIRYNILKAEQKTDELLRVNPAGSVPFIEDEADGQSFFLGDSRAISRYIVTRYGKDSGLIPDEKNFVAFAKFEEAAAIEVASFDPAANPLVLEELFKPTLFGRETDQHLAQYHRRRLVPVLDLLDKKLANQAFMAGEKLTLVDFFYVPYVRYLVEKVWPASVQERPHLSEWWARVTKLDAYNAVYGAKE